MTPYDPEMVSSRLHALLESAREANNTDANRIPLRDFLARLQNEAEATEGYKLRQTQLTVANPVRGALHGHINDFASSQDALVSRATQTSVATATRAMQTDAATISMWKILPQARQEAYERGFLAGKEVGLSEGTTRGKAVGMAEGLAIGLQQGQAEVFQQTQEAKLQRGVKYIGSDEWMEESRQSREEESGTKCQDVVERHKTTAELIREKITVKLPPPPAVVEKGKAATSTRKEYVTSSSQVGEVTPNIGGKDIKPALRKENVKPSRMGIDPFQSLVGLALKK